MSFLNFSLGSKKNKANKSKSANHPLSTTTCSSSLTTTSTTTTPTYDYHGNNKPLFLTSPYVTHMLVKGNFKTITELPKYIDQDEWLAFNTFEFFNHVNMFYGSITDFCTPHGCPTMSAGPVEYTWIDATTGKKLKLSAPQYIDSMASHIEAMILDEALFPTRAGKEFPLDFKETLIKRIFGQLIRLFAHIYHHHYDKIVALHEEPHLNSLFAHFVSFSKEFGLLDKKDLFPLQELIQVMMDEGIIS